jgi:uncharacterized protein
VLEQEPYLPSGQPFPTTYHLSCPYAVGRVSALEAAGGIARYERLVAAGGEISDSYHRGAELQRSLRRPAAVMVDGGASLSTGIAGTVRDAAVKCLHAHIAFALAHPDYALGGRAAEEAAPLFPATECCSA